MNVRIERTKKMNKRVLVTIIGGAVIGGLTAAAGVYSTDAATVAIFSSATGLVGALVAYFGGK